MMKLTLLEFKQGIRGYKVVNFRRIYIDRWLRKLKYLTLEMFDLKIIVQQVGENIK